MNYKRVKAVILEKGLKKSFIAKKIGISNVWLSYYLNGKKDLSFETEEKLKRFLEL